MLLEFSKFYKERGILTYSRLATLKVWPIRELPLNSAIHFSDDGESLFPDTSNIFVKTTKKRVLLRNVLELLPENKTTGKHQIQLNNLVLKFISENPNFANFTKPLLEAKDPQQLLFVNYNLIKALYRYQESDKMTPWHKWVDRQNLLWSEINECVKGSQRNHFISFQVPMELPSKARLEQFKETFNSQLLEHFQTSEFKFILDLWKWLDPETRHLSCMSKVEPNNLDRCNILFTVADGRSAVLNLGMLDSWIDKKDGKKEKPRGIDASAMKLFILKFFMSIQALNVELLAFEREAESKQEDDRQIDKEASPEDDFDLGGDDSDVLAGRNVPSRTDNIGDDIASSLSPGSEARRVSSDVHSGEAVYTKDIQDEDSGEEKSLDDQLKELEKETSALEVMEQRREVIRGKSPSVDDAPEFTFDDPTPKENIAGFIFQPRDSKERLLERLDHAVGVGNITAVDFRKISKVIEEQDNKPDPFGSKRSMKEMTTITPEDIAFTEERTKFVDDETIPDKSMLASVVESLDRDYINKTMTKDVVSSIMGVQSAGVLVTNLEIEKNHSVLGGFVSVSATLKPINGRTSVVRMKYPLINEDGTFKANGVRYHMRKQRVDLPIYKIAPTRVALSSYYGKLFVFRSPKKADTALEMVFKHITAASNGEPSTVARVKPSNVFNNKLTAPYVYSALSEQYKGFEVNHPIFGTMRFDFEHPKRFESLLNGKTEGVDESNGKILVGVTQKGRPIVIDSDNNFEAILPNGSQPLGDIFDILELDRTKAAVDPAMTKIRGATIPVGIILARTMGIKKLLKFSGARYRVVKGRQQKNLKPFEYVVSFEDQHLILDRRDKRSSLVFGGFEAFSKYTKAYPAASFEKKETYDDLLATIGANVTVLREIDLLETSYVDPITRDVLKQMGEPETYLGLLIRSCELLETYYHPDTQDFKFQQVRGYERIAGAIYREMIRSTRAFMNKNISGKGKVEMSPFAVWQGLMEDRSVKTCEDINPIQNVKMHESVTYAGEGGRDKDSFMVDDRAFGESDAGRFSEASVDSGDVGYNLFMTGNPLLKNVRGLATEGDVPPEAGHYLSSSLLLAVGAQHDDGKRNVFVSIQNAHTIATVGARQPRVQTGYEKVIANRSDSLFSFMAEEDGKVVSVAERGILVEYKSGEQKGVFLGRQYGNAEGSTYPHDIVTPLKTGDKFLKGDVIAYNTGYFEEDFFNPKRIVLKMQMPMITAFEESAATHEDSCTISTEMAKKMAAKTTKVKSFIVKFNQNLHDVQKLGTDLGPDTVLMSIEDEITSGTGLFDAESSALLGKLSRMNPRSGYTGVLDKIEVFYHGEKGDMSPSLKAIADRSDRIMVESCKAAGQPVVNGRVTGDYRVAGKNLQLDTAELKFYITVENTMGVGDKGVVANQLKTTVGKVVSYDIHTESGLKVDGTFGGRSAIKRIVHSYGIEGSTTRNLMAGDEMMVKIYEG